jgi:copper transport protein
VTCATVEIAVARVGPAQMPAPARRQPVRAVAPCSARWWRTWGAVAVLAVLLACPGSALAHAQLVGTVPAHESEVAGGIDSVEITFSEQVTAPFGAIKVYGPDGERLDRGTAGVDGKVVTSAFEPGEAGTHAVSWRVTSADGHPVRGAFVFHVDERSDGTAARDAAQAASAGNRTMDVAFGVARAGILLGVLAAVGGVLFSVLAAGSWRPRWLRSSLLLALASLVAAYVLDVAIAAGLSVREALAQEILREQATTVYGSATIVRLLLVALCLTVSVVVASRRWHRPAVRYACAPVFVALTASLSLSGHAVGEGVTALRLPLDMVHVVAAAAWLGGLAQLVPWSRATPVSAPVLERWSKIALGSVVVLVLTGFWAAWEEIGISLAGLLETTYGRLVLAKLVLLALVLPLANRNRVQVVPAVRAGGAGATAALRRYVRAELGVLMLVIAATAWLIQTPPAKVQLQPPFVEQTVDFGNRGTVQLVIDPATVGRNELHVYAFDQQLQVDGDVTDITLTAYSPERELGPLDLELVTAGPGHYTTPAATIPFAGSWEFTIRVRRGEFDERSARVDVDVAPD